MTKLLSSAVRHGWLRAKLDRAAYYVPFAASLFKSRTVLLQAGIKEQRTATDIAARVHNTRQAANCSAKVAGCGTSRRKNDWLCSEIFSSANAMIRKLASGKYRLYSRKKNPKTGRRRNLGTFSTRTAAEKHERAVQFYKRH